MASVTGNFDAHKDEVKNAAKEGRGHVKDKVGEATGGKQLRAEEGVVQKAADKVKESGRALKK